MLLKKAEQNNTYFKAAARGPSGSGKTWWVTAVAIGLQKYLGSKKPVAFWDTEDALSYVLPHFKANNIDVLELKSRTFKDAPSFFKESIASCDIAIIDSMTHIWYDAVDSFMKRKGIKKMRVWDWGQVKPVYREHVLDNIITSPLHLLIAGRISDIFEFIDIDGEKILTTTGSKMAAEKNTEYEPSLTVELERFTLTDDELKEIGMAIKRNQPVSRVSKASRYRMTVIKDRANVLGGVYEFEAVPGGIIKPDNQIFTAVKPFCDALNIGGSFSSIDTHRTSEDVYGKPDTDRTEYERQRTIAIEEIEVELKANFGHSKDDKQKMKGILEGAFNTASWTKIKTYDLELLREGLAEIRAAMKPAVEESGSHKLGTVNPLAQDPDILKILNHLDKKKKPTLEDAEQAMEVSDYPGGDDPARINGNLLKEEWKVAIGKVLQWYLTKELSS